MKVKELIEVLKTCNPEHDVVLQKDSEGNGYETMRDWEDDLMFVHKDGKVFRKQDAEDYDLDFKPNCVVLAP